MYKLDMHALETLALMGVTAHVQPNGLYELELSEGTTLEEVQGFGCKDPNCKHTLVRQGTTTFCVVGEGHEDGTAPPWPPPGTKFYGLSHHQDATIGVFVFSDGSVDVTALGDLREEMLPGLREAVERGMCQHPELAPKIRRAARTWCVRGVGGETRMVVLTLRCVKKSSRQSSERQMESTIPSQEAAAKIEARWKKSASDEDLIPAHRQSEILKERLWQYVKQGIDCRLYTDGQVLVRREGGAIYNAATLSVKQFLPSWASQVFADPSYGEFPQLESKWGTAEEVDVFRKELVDELTGVVREPVPTPPTQQKRQKPPRRRLFR